MNEVIINSYKVLVGKLQAKKTKQDVWHGWKDNLQTAL
jgi:hypothetical protein